MNRTLFITGGTGSLGSRIVKRLVYSDYYSDYSQIVVFSRGEQKQYNLRKDIADSPHYDSVKFVIGDIRNQEDVRRAFRKYSPDVVIHTAAQKHVRVCDENPELAVATNVLGTSNIVEACKEFHTDACCFVSTDKAVNPTTTYGMTKSIAEKIITNAEGTFCGVRYGNVTASAGSLLPLYKEISQIKGERVFPLTDKNMTRFLITFEQAMYLIFYQLENVVTDLTLPYNELFEEIPIQSEGTFVVPLLKSAKIKDIAELFATKYQGKVELISPYPSEKIHEELQPGYLSSDYLISKGALKTFLEKEGLL